MGNENCILVTGGAGFIGSNFIHQWMRQSGSGQPEGIVNLDLLTYAGNPANLANLSDHTPYSLVHGDICDQALVERILAEHRPRAVVHFAAESHVDRSITGPEAFLRTNIDGTFNLLERRTRLLRDLAAAARANFRFLHVSTDEVYGTLSPSDPAFHEQTPYAPTPPTPPPRPRPTTSSAPGSTPTASHAIVTNCSNNYGPYQFPKN